MKLFFSFLTCLTFIFHVSAQVKPDENEFARQLEAYFQETGQRIIVLEKDISGLNSISGLGIDKLPSALTENTDYAFFNFREKYVVIYPKFLKERYYNQKDAQEKEEAVSKLVDKVGDSLFYAMEADF